MPTEEEDRRQSRWWWLLREPRKHQAQIERGRKQRRARLERICAQIMAFGDDVDLYALRDLLKSVLRRRERRLGVSVVEKAKKLRAMTVKNGCTVSEAATAKAMLDRLGLG